MAFQIEYFHERVLAEVESWSDSARARPTTQLDVRSRKVYPLDFRTRGRLVAGSSNCARVDIQLLAG